jgi:hypothetical protein
VVGLSALGLTTAPFLLEIDGGTAIRRIPLDETRSEGLSMRLTVVPMRVRVPDCYRS